MYEKLDSVLGNQAGHQISTHTPGSSIFCCWMLRNGCKFWKNRQMYYLGILQFFLTDLKSPWTFKWQVGTWYEPRLLWWLCDAWLNSLSSCSKITVAGAYVRWVHLCLLHLCRTRKNSQLINWLRSCSRIMSLYAYVKWMHRYLPCFRHTQLNSLRLNSLIQKSLSTMDFEMCICKGSVRKLTHELENL